MAMLALAVLLLAACNPAASELATATMAPPTSTFAPVPTSTPTQRPTRTPTEVPTLNLSVEALKLFQDVCEVIIKANPLAECIIVERENAPPVHRFVGFLGADGEPTGLGIDLDAEPTLCGQEDFPCDRFVFVLKPRWETSLLMIGDYSYSTGASDRAEAMNISGFTRFPAGFVVPISSAYTKSDILEEIGLRFVYFCGGNSTC